MPTSSDPRVIRSVAVTASDVVSAFEYNRRAGPRAVLRITPPFNGRMRARIHVEQPGEYDDTDPTPIHVDPETLLDTDIVPSYPTPEETEDELRSDPTCEYTIETHHAHHVESVRRWRRAAKNAIVDRVELSLSEERQMIEVKVLGREQ